MSFDDPMTPEKNKKYAGFTVSAAWFLSVMGCVLFWCLVYELATR